MMKIDNKEIADAFIGEAPLDSIYLGEKEVFSSGLRDYTVKGRSLVWNQLATEVWTNKESTARLTWNGRTLVAVPTGSSGTPGSYNWSSGWIYLDQFAILGHKLLMLSKVTRLSKKDGIGEFTPYPMAINYSADKYALEIGIKYTLSFLINVPASLPSSGTVNLFLADCITQFEDTQVFDLTQMFGAGNEPTTAQEFAQALGYSSIEEVPYIPYNPGEIKGVGDVVKQLAYVSTVRETCGLTAEIIDEWSIALKGLQNASFSSASSTPAAFTSIKVIAGHKYCQLTKTEGKISSRTVRCLGGFSSQTSSQGGIITAISNADGKFYLYSSAIGSEWDGIIRIQVFDLTEMYGAGNEPATITEFANRLGYVSVDDIPYFPYGESANMPIVAKSRNLFNPDAEIVDVPYDSGTRKGIKISDASGTYYGRLTLNTSLSRSRFYYLGAINRTTNTYRLLIRLIASTEPSQGGVVVVNEGESLYLISASGGSTFEDMSSFNICVNLSDALNGTYTPYYAPVTYPVVISSPLHKVNDVADEARYSDKGVTRKYGVAKLKDLTDWARYGTETKWLFYANVPGGRLRVGAGNRVGYLVTGYEGNGTAQGGTATSALPSGTCRWDGTGSQILIVDRNFNDAASFKAHLTDDDILVYELATPVTEPVVLPRIKKFKGMVLTTDTEVKPSEIEIIL